MNRWMGRVAIVTGASSGIGAGVCVQLAEEGMTVVAVARRKDKLDELVARCDGKKGSIVAYQCDLMVDAEILSLFSFVSQKTTGVDVLINNAGMNGITSLLDGTAELWADIMNLNVIALTRCTQLAIQSMLERDVEDGQIINISSLAGHQVLSFPHTHFYGASKLVVRSVSEGFRLELQSKGKQIRVSTLSPGLVRTGMRDRLSDEVKSQISPQFLTVEDIALVVKHMIGSPANAEILDIKISPTGFQLSPIN